MDPPWMDSTEVPPPPFPPSASPVILLPLPAHQWAGEGGREGGREGDINTPHLFPFLLLCPT
jgi:hypothetical protein